MLQPSSYATRTLPFDATSVAEAARAIAAGACVAVPTETVYGLAADATNGEAVACIYAAKRRPAFNPLIVHVAHLAAAERLGIFDSQARALAKAHWPGPLTLVVPSRSASGVASLATAGLPTIALRVPAHRAMRAVLDACGRPLAAPSANGSGAISPTRAAHVLATLDGRIPLIIDDGPCAIGLESTIVACSEGELRLLRAGPLTIPGAVTAPTAAIEAPGQLPSHYAPGKPLRLDVTQPAPDEYMIGFDQVPGDATLSAVGDLVEAAARLFDLLHRADSSPATRIAIAPIPAIGIGVAIDDRLRRAATRDVT